MSAVGKPKIVLLGQKDPYKEVELTADEGAFESWLAVAQDMWGLANLSPFDSIFASRAIGTIVPTQGGNFGVLTYQLGYRLFTFSREGGIWIDAFEAESALSKLEKRPKDKVKLATWKPGSKQLAGKRMTHMAILSPSRMPGTLGEMVREAAGALKKDAQVFVADMMCGPKGKPCILWKHRPEEYRANLEAAGLKFYSEMDITGDVRVALLRGLHNSLNMVANIRKLREPWKGQRFKAFEKELETVIALHMAIERGEAVAMGMYYTKV
ncbi:MAG: hypothetical protein P4L57_05700 [Rhizomicrobium sp.]|nr:hypothetical protein [Rhizomicrobium sp.]